MDKETVCAVVVTYNRKRLLIECLEALENQTKHLNAIYIIDNASSDETPQLLQEKGYINKISHTHLRIPMETCFKKNEFMIYYIQMHENTGGAGGFHEGVKRAYKKGYDWMWLMDDDVEPEKNCLKNLLKYKTKSKVLVPLRMSKKTAKIEEYADIKYNLSNPFLMDPKELKFMDKFKNINEIPEIVEIQTFSFEGPLINRDIIKIIGYPRKDLFIYGDDTDYSLKISYQLKNKIILIKDALMYRKLEIIEDTTKWKQYYMLRNPNVILWIHGENTFVKLKPLIISLLAISFNLIKLNLERTSIWYYTLIDFWKKRLPIRYKPI